MESGEPEAARDHLEKALRIERRLQTVTFGDPEVERGMMAIEDLLGELATGRGHLSVALEHFGEALAIARRIAAREDNVLHRRAVGVALSRLADVMEKRGEEAAALERRLEAQKVFAGLLQLNPGHARWQAQGAAEAEKIARLRARLGPAGQREIDR
jgi:hypothetical protein